MSLCVLAEAGTSRQVQTTLILQCAIVGLHTAHDLYISWYTTLREELTVVTGSRIFQGGGWVLPHMAWLDKLLVQTTNRLG